jgi:ribosomal protein S18 acetylase RimI-like enzyme
MTEAIRIAPLQAQHLPPCAAIIGRLPLFERYGFGEQAAARLLHAALDEPRAVLLVAQEQAEVAGFAWFVRRGGFDRSGYLRLIAVDDRWQGRGVGQQLLHELERRHLTEGGILLLAESSNSAAHAFYQRLGYRQVGEIPDYVRPGLNERIFYKPPSTLQQVAPKS